MAVDQLDLSDQGKKIENVEKDVGKINTYMIGIVAVMVFGFIALLFTVVSLVITYQHDNADSYREYRDEIKSQNDKIDSLTNELKIQNGKTQSTAPANVQ
jgi:hypothetical protein